MHKVILKNTLTKPNEMQSLLKQVISYCFHLLLDFNLILLLESLESFR